MHDLIGTFIEIHTKHSANKSQISAKNNKATWHRVPKKMLSRNTKIELRSNNTENGCTVKFIWILEFCAE